MEQKIYSTKELAELLKVNIRTIQRMTKDEKIQFVKKENRISYFKFSGNDNNSENDTHTGFFQKTDRLNDNTYQNILQGKLTI